MKVAIVARAPDTRYLAPFHEQGWDIWTCSPLGAPSYTDIPRWNNWYEIHQLDEKEVECPGYLDFLKLYGDRVWIREPHHRLPDAQIYPLEDVVSCCGENFVNGNRYYTNTVSLMIAHAIMLGVKELGVYGTNMAQHSEYGGQKPSCELFLGLAAGKGIKVTIPQECDLMKAQRIYGIESPTTLERKLAVRERELEERIQMTRSRFNAAKTTQVSTKAAHQELAQLLEAMNGDAPDTVKQALLMRQGTLMKGHQQANMEAEQTDEELKLITGALEEVRYQLTFT